MKNHFYTEEEIEWLRVNYKIHDRKKLTMLFNNEFNCDISDSAMKSTISSYKILSNRTGRFEKGQSSWNKGKVWNDYMTPEGMAESSKTTFKKGQKPVNTHPIGTVIMREDGYFYKKIDFTIPSRKGWRQVHRLVWEEHYGSIPKGYNIIFLDGNRSNIDISNLKMVSMKQHATMCKLGLYSTEKELTESGLLTVEVIQKTTEMRGKYEKQIDRSKQSLVHGA